MRKTILLNVFSRCRKTLIAFVLFLFSFSAAANTISAGDMAVIGMNTVLDEVQVVTFVPLPAGTVIHFTDRGWNQATNSFTTSTSGDGTITWTVSSPVPAGTVLLFYMGGIDAPTTLKSMTTSMNFSGSISVNGYTSAPDPLLATGDQFYIYQDSDTNPYFIFAMNNSSGPVDGNNWNTSATSTLRDGMLPNGVGSQNALTNGVNAVGLPGGTMQLDNVQYTGATTSTSKAAWLSRIVTSSNWSGDNIGTVMGTIANIPVPFVLLPIRLIDFSAKTLNNGSVSLQWTIAATDENSLFEIEHSLNATSFTVIGTLNGRPATTDATYRFATTHSSAGGYYRLRYTDAKGVVGYSKTVAIPGRKSNLSLQVYPNPISGNSITVAVKGTPAANLVYQVVNSAGHRVSGGTLKNNVHQIGLGALPAGVYVLQVSSVESIAFEKK
ncbi:MAG TPA: T9SS type A sorting domain-containing protein [Flavisolibacter sp.]|nr:T9SS type A sorting domain-containing protein [Flavisolibacter sp.]